MTVTLIRILFVTLTGFIGSQVSGVFGRGYSVGIMGGVAFGLVMVLTDRLLKGISLRLFSSATFGLLMGLLFAHLLRASDMLRGVSQDTEWVISLLLYVSGAYLGTMLALRSNRQDFSLIIPYVRFREESVQDSPLLVDSNILIDGRVGAMCGSGFLSSRLVVPRFVLEELQRLADSKDSLKRARGRRGMEQARELQRDTRLNVTIQETSADPGAVDSQLVQLARVLHARLLTNDHNLCELARLQGVSALNLHELEKALKPALAMGDHLELTLSKEGREAHQAVGYLPDGTMVVVNHARQHLGETVPITISSALQTGAGRLFFGELEGGANHTHS